jgi:beta-glucosidase
MQDSPTGVRDTDFNSVFPAGVNVAATFSRGLAVARGAAMGAEHRDKGVDVQLGPVAGPLGRAPAGGRNWEGFSPDPYLTGIMIAQSVIGIQSSGVIACAKHFIGNEQEHFRQVPEAAGYGYDIEEALSSNIDDRTMHELYLWPFADAVQAGVGSIMCAYTQINNSYSCQNSYILNYLLKSELDFQGFVMSDWSAQHAGVATALAGMDMSMPGDTTFNSGLSFWGTNLTLAVANGTVPEWRIDDMATRIMAAYYKVGRDTSAVPINFDSFSTNTFDYQHIFAQKGYGVVNEHVDVRDDHAAVIRQLGSASTVLLKNTNKALPLNGKEKSTTVFGEDAGSNPLGPNGCSDRGCDMGTLGMAWGSGSSNFPYLITPISAIENEVVGQNGGVFQAITNNTNYAAINALASQASVALVFVNADSGEGYISVDGNEGDRNNLTLWGNGEGLIQNVTSFCNNTVVVIHSTGPVLVNDWYQNDNVTAILWAGIPGQESGNSIADVLYGRVNPAARLPFTIGSSRDDYGTDIMYQPNGPTPQLNYTEGLFIDYRAFDKKNITPVYEFGFGLSYTTFNYSNILITPGTNTTYTPTTGQSAPAPSSNASVSTNLSDYVYPTSFDQIKGYIYPYLNSTDAKSASEDPYYDANYTWPESSQSSAAYPLAPAGGSPGGNAQLWDIVYTVTATITNNGSLTGEEVPQLYLSFDNGDPLEPVRVLRGFDRLSIPPGGSTAFTAELKRRDISTWNTSTQNWDQVPASQIKVAIGASSRDLRLFGTLG